MIEPIVDCSPQNQSAKNYCRLTSGKPGDGVSPTVSKKKTPYV